MLWGDGATGAGGHREAREGKGGESLTCFHFFCLLILWVCWGHRRKCFSPWLCTTRVGRVKICGKGVLCVVCSQRGWYGLGRSSELTPGLFAFERSDRLAQSTTSSPWWVVSFHTSGQLFYIAQQCEKICWHHLTILHWTGKLPLTYTYFCWPKFECGGILFKETFGMLLQYSAHWTEDQRRWPLHPPPPRRTSPYAAILPPVVIHFHQHCCQYEPGNHFCLR